MPGSWQLQLWPVLAQVTCAEPYEWKDPTEGEWEFSPAVQNMNGDKPFHVRGPVVCIPSLHWRARRSPLCCAGVSACACKAHA